MSTLQKPAAESSRSVADDAARWFLSLQEPAATSETFREWQQWLNAAPEHRQVYAEMEETVLRLGRVPVMPKLPSAQEMARDTYDGSQPIAQWLHAGTPRSQGERKPWQRKHWHRVAMAAGLALVSLAGAALWLQSARDIELGTFTYRTAPGQRQLVTLPEGSRVTLDADSTLEVRLESGSRALTLERGEAFFEVAKDKARPFVVRAGAAQVTAVGTAFNVRMSGNRTVVAVTEGKVEVDTAPKSVPLRERILSPRTPTAPRFTAQVSAGEAVSYVDDGNLQALPAAEAPLATTWLDGRRQYRNELLRYVLADVGRYTGKRIEIAGEAAELRFTGTLNLKNGEAWLRGLSVALPVVVVQEDDGLLRVRQK